MRTPACIIFSLLFAACASVSAPMEPLPQGSRIGRADLAQLRVLLSQARNDLDPRQWEMLDRRLTAAEQAFERFSNAAKRSGQVAEVVRGAEGVAQVGRASTVAGMLSQLGPLLLGMVLLWPSSTAGPELDSRSSFTGAQQEFEARLRDVSETSQQILVDLETQPRATRAPAQQASPQKHSPTALPDEDDTKCTPIPLPRHLGGHAPHNECADKMPGNSFPGGDVYVNGKAFDALQLATRTLWEVKTDDFDRHSPRSQRFFAVMKLPEIQREKQIAESCGYNFIVGVRSAAQKVMLEQLDRKLDIVIMDWC